MKKYNITFKYSEQIIANILKRLKWQDLPEYKSFLNEIEINNIKKTDSDKIVDTYELFRISNYDKISEITGIDVKTCKLVLELAVKYNLLNQL